MGDANPIRILGDYSKPSHEGYKNTIELPVGNNVVPLRSDIIRLVQNECSFHGLRSKDPNQHLKDFLKLVDSLDLDDPSPDERILLLVSLLNSFHREERDAEESWALLEDLALYDNESWNKPRDFAKPVKAISLPQDVPMNKITTSCEICTGPHDTQYCIEDPEQTFVEYASLQTNETGSRQFTMNQGPRNFHEAANTWKGKLNFNWAHAQTFTSPRNGSFSTYSASYQTKLEKALIDFDSHQEKRLSSLRAQLGQQQDGMISKINLLWKAVSEKLDDTPIRNTVGNPAAQMNFTSTNDPTREELRGKGIKSPSKLLSPKYFSQSSLAEQIRKPSSSKRVHFVNSIIILNKEDETKEVGNVKTSTTEYEDHERTVKSEEEFGEETEDEIKEEEEDSPKHFDTFPTMK
ncbi:hypothetical protein Tco_0232963 [Tanacetum coccineum]